MAWSFVQGQKFSFTSGSSQSGTLSTNITSGNRLVVLAYVYGSGITLSKVADNLGNQGATSGQYDQILVQADPFNGHLYWLTAPITTGGSCTITVTASGSASFISFWAGEYSGLSTLTGSSAWDVTVSGNGTIAASMGTGTSSGVVPGAGELALAGFGDTIANGANHVISPNGWTERQNDTAAATDLPLIVNDQIPTQNSTISWTATFGGSDASNGFAAALVVLKLPPVTPQTWFYPPLTNFTQPGLDFTPAIRSTSIPQTKLVDISTRFIVQPQPTGTSLQILANTGARGATGGNQRGNHLIYAQNTGRWWFFTYGAVLDSGTATSGTIAALNDTTKNWTASIYRAASCIIIAGTGVGQAFEIGPNTSTQLQVYNNGSASPPQPGLATAPDSTSQYIIVESRSVKAFVSSGADLTTATWSEATGSPSPTLPNNSGIDVSGGANDSGSIGSDIPTDGRLVAAAYMNVNNTDVVQLLTNENLHWIKYSERARLGIGTPSTISWDLTGPVTWYDAFDSHNEAAPQFPQTTAIRASNTNRWHILQNQNGLLHSGMVANPSATDDGSNNKAPAWGGTYVDADSTNIVAWTGSLTPLDSGFMLAAYVKGNKDAAAVGTNISHQTGIRYLESSSESAWPTTAGGTDVPNLSTASNSPNDWDIVARTTTDIHLIRRNGPTTLEQIRYTGHNGSWGSVTTLPTAGLTGHLSGSGIALVTDGTNVWCFVIDTDLSHSIRYIKWSSVTGAWDSSWSTLPAGNEYKNFIVATWSYTTKQAAVAWQGNYTYPYTVNFQVFEPPRVSWNPLQSFSQIGPQLDLIQDVRSTNVPSTKLVDIKTRLLVVPGPPSLLDRGTFHPGQSPGGYQQFWQDVKTQNAPTTSYANISTRFVLRAVVGAFVPSIANFEFGTPTESFVQDARAADVPTTTNSDLKSRLVVVRQFTGSINLPSTYHPGVSPGGAWQFMPDQKSANPPTVSYGDVKTRFVVNTQQGAVQLFQNAIVRPGLQGPSSADILSFLQDTRTYDSPITVILDLKTRFTISAGFAAAQVGIVPTLVHPGLQGPIDWSSFTPNVLATNSPTTSYGDLKTRLNVQASIGSTQPANTYHPGSSPGGYAQFLQDSRAADPTHTVFVDIKTRLIVSTSPGTTVSANTFHPGSSPGGYSQFLADVRAANAPTVSRTDIGTRLIVLGQIPGGSLVQPSPFAFVGPSEKLVQDFRSATPTHAVFADLNTRFIVQSSSPTGVLSSYIFTGRLGRAESQLGSMQLGIDRTFYIGALEAPTTSITTDNTIKTANPNILILQRRPFTFTVQNRAFTITIQKKQ